MLLTMDVGNTQTHIGMFDGVKLREHWRLATDRDATADRLGADLSALLSLRGLSMPEIHGAIVSSVVPQLTPEYAALSERYFEGALLVVGPGIKTGMPIRMDNPHEVGADRLVNAIAAYDRFGASCISVDFGTAINFDVVSASGEYLGGVLGPGVDVSLDALSQRAARLFTVDLVAPATVIGRSTETALQSGVVYGFAGAVDGILRRVWQELDGEVPVVATGGHAGVIAPHCEEVNEVDDLLTLTGLRLIHERNA